MHVNRHRYLYDRLAPLVSPSLLERFWRLPSSTFYLEEAPPLEEAGILVIFAFDTPIYVCKCDYSLDELSDQYASILSGEWVDADDVEPHLVRRQRFAWEGYLDHSFDDESAESVDHLLPLRDYKGLFLSVDSATDLSMWVSLLISSLRPACNIDVYDDAVGRAIALDDLSDPPTSEQTQRLVRIDGRYIRYLQTPDEAIQLSAVRQTPWALVEILNMGLSPSHAVILAALEGDGLTLKLINEPNRQMQEIAIGANGNAIAYVAKPDEELQLIAVNNAPWALGWIAEPSYQAKLSAIGHVPSAITLLDLQECEADQELLLLAFQREPTVVRRVGWLPQSFWDYLCLHDPLAEVEKMLKDSSLTQSMIDSMKETLLPRLLRLLKESRSTYALTSYLDILQKTQIEWPELALIRRAVAAMREEQIQRAADQLPEDLN